MFSGGAGLHPFILVQVGRVFILARERERGGWKKTFPHPHGSIP